MDSSISKALIIVAGVLTAMLVIALITVSFNKISQWAASQDNETVIEQAQKFNKEFEAYDKDLMYGVDVISCLNKAMSNNDKIHGRYAEALDTAYEMKIVVNLKNVLQESITVYYMNNNSEVSYPNGSGPYSVKIRDVGFNFLNTDYYTKSITKFQGNNALKSIEGQNCNLPNVLNFELTAQGNGTNETTLRALLSVVNTLSEIKKNPSSTDRVKPNSWTKAEFRSALYDLKTRKFSCQGIYYSSNTGRVNKIEFEEK